MHEFARDSAGHGVAVGCEVEDGWRLKRRNKTHTHTHDGRAERLGVLVHHSVCFSVFSPI